jgi:hypothetical protein
VLLELLSMVIHTLMGAEADAPRGAGYGELRTERTKQRRVIVIVNSTRGLGHWMWRSEAAARFPFPGLAAVRAQAH